MAQTSLIIGDTNWAVKEDSLLGYNVIQDNYLPIPIDCVRATTATRVNEQGLIEIVPRNLFTSSEQIDTADWVKQGVSATANQAISPNGTLTAQLLDDGTAASTQHWIFQNPSLLNGATYTISFYAKYISRKFMAVNIFNGLASQYVYYNIQDGLVSGSTGDVTASITSVGNGWFRIVYTRSMATSGSAPNFRIGFADDTLNITYTGSNKQAYVWGAQLEQGSVATEYFPTTNRLDIPRIDYSTGTASLLVEPQRTNLALNSDGNLSTYPTAINVTNASSSFNSFSNAIQFPSTGLALAYKSVATTAQTYAISVFIKMDDNSVPILSASQTTGNFCLVIAGAIATNNLKVESYGNNVYRLSATATSGAVNINNGLIRYDTQVLKSFKITGIQLEAGSYATSYIPTIASTVTRNADVISRTGISSLIGQTEGTFFAEIQFLTLPSAASVMSLNANESNRISLYASGGGNAIKLAVFNGGSLTVNIQITLTGQSILNNNKIAVRYSPNNWQLWFNGVKIGENLTAGTFAANTLNTFSFSDYSGTTPLEARVKNVQLYKTALSDSELQSLTTI